MSLRETLNKNPALTTGATAVIIIVALGYIVWSLVGGPAQGEAQPTNFTSDDGATWFGGSDQQLAPFDVDGKEAVQAHLFTCDDGSNKFVGYMTRYKPEVKKAYVEAQAAAKAAKEQGRSLTKAELNQIMNAGRALGTSQEWKLPGADNKWAPLAPGMNVAAAVKCPDGSSNNLKQVGPTGELTEVRDFGPPAAPGGAPAK